jgi:hypothetical protein
MPKFRIHIIVLVFVVVLGIALAVQHLLFGSRTTSLLLEDITKLPGVTEAEINRIADGVYELVVTLRPRIDLKEVYPLIVKTGEYRLPNQIDSIALNGTGQLSPEFKEIWHIIHFSMEEAVITGEFTRMAETIDRIVEASDLTYHWVSVDRDNVYLYLEKGDSYLYQVVPRHILEPEAEGGVRSWFGR